MLSKTLKTTLLVLAMALWCTCTTADNATADTAADINVTSTTNRSTANIGDLIEYQIKIEYPQTTKIRLPRPGTELGGMSVKSYDPGTPEKISSDRVLLSVKYSLDSLVTGSYILGPLEIGWKTPEMETFKTLETDQIFIEITSVDEDNKAQDIRDIKKPANLPSNLWKVVTAAVVLLILLAVLVLLIVKKRKTGPKPTPVKPQVPPAQEALASLEEIKNRNLVVKGMFKEYYFQVSGVLRRYIERRFSVPVTEKTTEEFISQMTRSSVLSDSQQSMVKSYLQHCDMVKFAKYEPSVEDTTRIFETAKEFVLNSQPAQPENNQKAEQK